MLAITLERQKNIFCDAESVVQHYGYSSFGKLLFVNDGAGLDVTEAPVIKQPFTYTNREFDSESGLYFYRARMYDAGLGRFLQTDPDFGIIDIPLSKNNRYIYVLNNPSIYVDPNGEYFEDYKYGHS